MRQKSGNKNFDDNIKLWQDQGWQNRGMTVFENIILSYGLLKKW